MKEGWTYKKLGEVCEVLNGFAFKSNQYVHDGIRVIRITNVQKGYVEDKDPKYYPLETQSELKRYLLKENDLLISLTGNVGRVGILNDKLLPAYLNQRVGCLRIKKNELLIPFLFYFLNSNKFENDCIESSTGAAQKNMSTVWLSKYMIPTPSLSEQQRIVSRLDSAFAHIDELKANAEKQLSEARTLFQKALTKAMEPKEGWEEKTLKEVSTIAGDYGLSVPSKPFDGVRYLRITDITDWGDLNDDIVSANVDSDNKQEELEEGDILFARTGATVGKTLVYKKEFGECLFAGYLIRYRLNKDIILPRYMYYVTHSKEYYDWVFVNQEAAAQPNISAKKYNLLPVKYPPLSEQQRIVSRMDSLSAHVRELEEVTQKTNSECDVLKQALLRKVFE